MSRRVQAAGLLFLCAATLAAQSATDLNVTEYQKRLGIELYEAGQRHLELGSWARKMGLVPQATAQFLRASEVSEGKNNNAEAVLASCAATATRSGGSSARSRRTRCSRLPAPRRRRRAREPAGASRAGARGRQGAHAAGATAAPAHRAAARGKLVFDDKGKARLEGDAIPDELAAWLRDNTQAVSNGQRAFDPPATRRRSSPTSSCAAATA